MQQIRQCCVLILNPAYDTFKTNCHHIFITSTFTRAQDDNPFAMITRIEAAQIPDRGGYDGLTLQGLMQRFHLPSVSIAVIKD